jgi:threonine synthase
LQPFFAGDPLEAELPAMVGETFAHPMPLVELAGSPAGDGSPPPAVLELFHGPTAAFKDFGARFLAACLSRVPRDAARPLTILVATSGDTGGAVAAAFHGRPGTRVVVLYPRGLVSPLHERQLTCWGDSVTSLCVEGTFDDCQKLVKAAFADPELSAAHELSSANSIGRGRLAAEDARPGLLELARIDAFDEPRVQVDDRFRAASALAGARASLPPRRHRQEVGALGRAAVRPRPP